MCNPVSNYLLLEWALPRKCACTYHVQKIFSDYSDTITMITIYVHIHITYCIKSTNPVSSNVRAGMIISLWRLGSYSAFTLRKVVKNIYFNNMLCINGYRYKHAYIFSSEPYTHEQTKTVSLHGILFVYIMFSTC